jgi:hypothetical protein
VLFPSKSVVQDRHREAGYVLDLAASPAQALLPPCIRWPASPTLSRRPVAASNGGSIRPYKSWTHVFDELIERRPVRTGILNVPQGISRLGRLLVWRYVGQRYVDLARGCGCDQSKAVDQP